MDNEPTEKVRQEIFRGKTNRDAPDTTKCQHA